MKKQTVEITRNNFERTEGVDTVKVTLQLAWDETKVDQNMQDIIMKAGLHAIGQKYLTKYHAETEEATTVQKDASELAQWFTETDGTRGSKKQDYEHAIEKLQLATASVNKLATDLAAQKIDMAKFMELMPNLQAKQAEAQTAHDEAKAAYDEFKAKAAAARSKNNK